MIKKLQKRGNSHALVLDKTMLEELGIGPDTLLQVTISSGCLVVRPASTGVGPEKVANSLKKIRSRPGYPEMLQHLAE
ncbi:MAG: AbrB/MazE/SpoVT family DNA-binding domain-containing protein [Candidatus Eremiobacteraeota bacterium]|nr:AbrB/MazE/SpoVT family DNA-binding domain-containing protein [Candidatus Eremiobacteraeota bacterium]MCW5870757.1 AbrB/MazE/SpoVT family DNA-binding domain-containing protein [Candidatus Eremiobacteraeota bacterium]